MLGRKEVIELASAVLTTALATACASQHDVFDGDRPVEDRPVDVTIEAQPGIKPSLSPATSASGRGLLRVEPPPLSFDAAPADLPWPDEPLEEPQLVLICADWVTACLSFDRGDIVRDREVRALAASFRTWRLDVTDASESHDVFLQRLEAGPIPWIAVTGCQSKPHRRSIRTLDVDTITDVLSACVARQP